MLLCPLENIAKLNLNWIQERPRVTQLFGKDFKINGKFVYEKMGLKGHNGLDFGCSLYTPIFAPCDGDAIVSDSGDKGYGLHIRIRSKHGGREVILAHLSNVAFNKAKVVNTGDFIGYTGNSGFSTAPHLHLGLRFLNHNANTTIWNWTVKDYNNGFLGYIDPISSLISFKGTLLVNNLIDKNKGFK